MIAQMPSEPIIYILKYYKLTSTTDVITIGKDVESLAIDHKHTYKSHFYYVNSRNQIVNFDEFYKNPMRHLIQLVRSY